MVTPLVDKIDFQYQIVDNQDHTKRSIVDRNCILRNVPMKAAKTEDEPEQIEFSGDRNSWIDRGKLKNPHSIDAP